MGEAHRIVFVPSSRPPPAQNLEFIPNPPNPDPLFFFRHVIIASL